MGAEEASVTALVAKGSAARWRSEVWNKIGSMDPRRTVKTDTHQSIHPDVSSFSASGEGPESHQWYVMLGAKKTSRVSGPEQEKLEKTSVRWCSRVSGDVNPGRSPRAECRQEPCCVWPRSLPSSRGKKGSPQCPRRDATWRSPHRDLVFQWSVPIRHKLGVGEARS